MDRLLIGKVVILVVVLGLAVCCAPAPTAVPPTPTPEREAIEVTITRLEDIVGVWQGTDMGALQFNADGSMLLSESLEGLPDLASHGECRFEGTQLIFEDADGSGEGSYTVVRSIQADKSVSLKFRAVKDPFIERRRILAQRVWYWVQP